jgi:hypothetical protein
MISRFEGVASKVAFAMAFGAALAAFSAKPAVAGETMTADEARRFVAGKHFAFNCFDGTRGAGRIFNDGSAVGTVQIGGSGPLRHARLPAGTLLVKGNAVCASIKGLYFEPCFNLTKQDEYRFRGAVSGMGFAYCDFTRRGGRIQMASAARARLGKPVDLNRPGELRPAAARIETKPVEARPLEAKPAESKPAESKAAETASIEPASVKLRPTSD